MRRFPVLAALVALASLAGSAAAGSSNRLAVRVIQMNIRFEFPSDVAQGNGWAARVERVAGAIKDARATVACIQEDKENQVEDLRRAMAGWDFVGRARDGRSSEHCSIAFDSARWQCAASGDLWLSDTPDVVASNTWGTKYPHKATWAELEARGDAKHRRVLVLGTHFDEHADSDAVRTKSARVLRTWLAANARDRNVILCGDFNAAPTDACHAVLTEDGAFKDCWDVLKPADPAPGTVHDFTGRAAKKRIDWILAGGRVVPLEAKVDRFNKDGKWPSDHYPVVAELEVGVESHAKKDGRTTLSR